MDKRRLLAVLAVALVASTLVAPGPARAGRSAIIERRVTFTVVNSNTSDLPCPSDGATYQVEGRLTGPRDVLTGTHPKTVSLYLHGFSLGGKYLWSFKDVRGYDWPVAMARLGHVSVSIDRLGYDDSGHPPGALTCLGSGADQTHQIVQSLRAGEYVVKRGKPVRFDRVVLVGHDTGGGIAEIEAYSYNDAGDPPDIDGLVVWGWAEQGYSQWVLDRLPERSAFCARGGEPAEDDDPASPSGYFWWPVTAEEVTAAIGRWMDPRVLKRALELRNRNPCGDLYSAATASEYHANSDALGDIRVPVLLIYEDGDVIYTREGAEAQPAHFTGTDDLTFVMLENAGHFPMLERNRDSYRRLVSDWLHEHSG